jgi:DNA-binding PadR family transcriptional regulator
VRLSDLGYALLTLLAREPLSGYDLARYMKRPVGFFWQAQHSQIYPELAHLEDQGYVLHEVITQEDRPQKKLYRLTEAGRTILKAWITQPPAPPPERNELLLKAYTIWLADRNQAIEMFRKQLAFHADRLTLYGQIQATIEQQSAGRPAVNEPLFGDYATVRMGVAYEREYVDWCRWMVEQLEQARESQGQDGS